MCIFNPDPCIDKGVIMKLSVLCILLFGLSLCACTAGMSGKDDSKLAEAIRIQGEAFLMQGDYTAALSRLLEARKMNPEDPYLLNSLGLAYMGKNRDDLAIPVFKQALDLKPDYTEALNNLGAAYLRQKKGDLAIPAFKKVLEDLLYPTPHFPLSNLGWAYLETQNYIQAESWFSQALDASPGYVTASHGLAQVFLETRREDQAIEVLKTGLETRPESAVLHADLARAYEAKGWIPEARQSWQKVLEYASARSDLKKTATARLSALD
jgi:Tfp pilus assembly protein PilF